MSRPIAGFPSRSAAVLALTERGMSSREIGATLGIEPSTVSALRISAQRRKTGIQPLTRVRAQRGNTAALETAIMDRWDAGRSSDQIAADLDLPHEKVRSILGYMREGNAEFACSAKALARCSAALVDAIRRHHPERCGA